MCRTSPSIVSITFLIGALAGCGTGAIGGEPSGAGDDDPADAGDDPVPGAPDASVPDPVPDAAPPLPTDNPLAAGIDVASVSIYQAVAIPLAENGAPVSPRNAPVIEGDDAVFAISFTVASGFTPRVIDACVTIDGVVYDTQQNVSASSGDLPTTTLLVKVPGAAITLTSAYAVSLHEADGAPTQPGSTAGASYPASGTDALGAVSPKGPLNLVLVPFRYNADGSGRMPPTDAATVAKYRDAFAAMYPVADVQVMLHAPVDTSINISGGGWSSWLDQLGDVRQADNPPSNHYYYGIASPKPTFGDFCNGGCTVGLGNVPSADNPFLFAAVGVSFPETLLISTALHEVGHTMGRPHVACGGPSGTDPNYPYFGGSIGVWGYDAVGEEWFPPSDYSDIMGYCDDQWISDYQYQKIFTRLSTVNGSSPAAFGPPQTYRVGLVDADGQVVWRRTATLALPPQGGEQQVSLRDQQGGELDVVDGHFFPFDHIAGGTIYVRMGGILDTVALAPAAYVVIDDVTLQPTQ